MWPTMRTSTAALFGLLAIVTAHVDNKNRQGRQLVFPIVRSIEQPTPEYARPSRRLESVIVANRSDIAYYARLTFGTPPQPQFVLLDTGSYELWVNPDCTALNNELDARFCQALGRYNASASSTSLSLGESKTLQYGIGNATFVYHKDTVGVSNSTELSLNNLQFGVATETEDAPSGILGLGYGKEVATKYPTFIDQLAEQGTTSTKVFSIALGGKEEEEGTLMFGGLDAGKFSGNLQTLPILPPSQSPDQRPRYWINLKAIGSSSEASNEAKTYEESRNLTVFLDTGSTMTLLPMALAKRIAADFGGSEPDDNGQFVVDCAMAQAERTLDFAFDGTTIRVPYSEMIREFGIGMGSVKCYLGVRGSDDFVLLGGSMLRSAYVVFDQTNNAIHLAQYVNCGSRAVEITADFDFKSTRGDCSPLLATDRPEVTSAIVSGNTPTSSTAIGPSESAVSSGSHSDITFQGLWRIIALACAMIFLH
ncbi:aspartic peptidase domain-containing protein [Microdochium trichocladiopsis]|uniref:Aspartic peptidase domain-containing protein n=1 Tax=Microdochium trichocladiopsis TaxID=1682393 RepID=A0A9P8YIX5_9PEZI|nr:aspartic peptidase domain-containing protein [Microdochium trichocladiopsis]KAH7041346.1 aspartic peptidase domain-containing protein [Microdochium trichocladiopsis]